MSLSKNEIAAKELVSNTTYINWIEKYMQKIETFNTNDIHFCKSKRDKAMIKKLPLFYKGIEMYARRNYIYPIVSGEDLYESYSYTVKYNNTLYTITIDSEIWDDIPCCTCTRFALLEQVMDFEDIMQDKDRENLDLIKDKVDCLTSTIEELCDLNISFDTINTIVEDTIMQIQFK